MRRHSEANRGSDFMRSPGCDPTRANPTVFRNVRPRTPTSGNASRAIRVHPSGPSRLDDEVAAAFEYLGHSISRPGHFLWAAAGREVDVATPILVEEPGFSALS